VEDEKNAVEFKPQESAANPSDLNFETYKDHRIAMSLAPLFLKYNSVTIADPDCVKKSYPLYWKDIQQTGIAIIEDF
jgi:3-phosphoshikimate 1-carboxyvinyltransferase